MSGRSASHVPLSKTPFEMSPIQLAARCHNTRSDGSHEPFCFELFRRAIVNRCALCWHYLHNQYYSLVCHWVCQRTSSDADTVADLVQNAFIAFWRFYTADKLDCARGLADVLKYLKSCAVSAAIGAYRQAEREPLTVGWNEQVVEGHAALQSTEASALQRMAARSLWAIIESSCRDQRERLLAHLTFVTGLRPRHIAERHPDLFPEVGDVYRLKRNLLDRLRRNPDLRAMLENRWNERLTQ